MLNREQIASVHSGTFERHEDRETHCGKKWAQSGQKVLRPWANTSRGNGARGQTPETLGSKQTGGVVGGMKFAEDDPGTLNWSAKKTRREDRKSKRALCW